MKKNLLFSLVCGALLVPVTVSAQYCTNNETTIDAGRHLKTIVLTCNGASTTVTTPTHSGVHAVYADVTATEVEVMAGKEVTITCTGEGVHRWIHGYLFIDYNNDGVFSDNYAGDYAPFNVAANGIPAEGSELVSYSYYCPSDGYNGQNVINSGFNSAGVASTANNESNLRGCGITEPGEMPNFTIPADLVAGTYRARFNVAWNTIDPCGEIVPEQNDAAAETTNSLADIGGNMVDFTLKVVADPSGIAQIANDEVSLYYQDGAIYTNVEGEIAIYNLTGKLVKSAFAAPVAVDDLAHGVYVAKAGGKAIKFVK